MNEKTFPKIISPLEKSFIRAVQERRLAIHTRKRLQELYGKDVMYRLIRLASSLNMRCNYYNRISDHFTELESQYSRMGTMRTERDDSIKVVILIVTMKKYNECWA